MSPGTSVAASTVCHLPSRMAVASGARPFFSAASAFEALRSCQNSSAALNNSRELMMTKSSQWPMQRGNERRRLDHVGDRPGEIAEQLAGEALLLLDEGVGAILGEAFFRLGAAQPLVRTGAELRQHAIERHPLEIDIRTSRGGGSQGGHGFLLRTRDTLLSR